MHPPKGDYDVMPSDVGRITITAFLPFSSVVEYHI